MTCVSVCVLGLAMAVTPLTQAFVAPGSGFSAVPGRDVASLASSKVGFGGQLRRSAWCRERLLLLFWDVLVLVSLFRPFVSCLVMFTPEYNAIKHT